MDCFENLHREHPAYAEAYAARALVMFEAGRFPEASDLLQRALSLRPALPGAAYLLSLSFWEEGMIPQAREAWRRAARMDPSLPPLPDGAK